jgi:hypothetical protein
MHRIIAPLLLTAIRSFSSGMVSGADARNGKARLAASSTTVSLQLKYFARDAKSTSYIPTIECAWEAGGTVARWAQTGESHEAFDRETGAAPHGPLNSFCELTSEGA